MGQYTKRKDGRFETKISTGKFNEDGKPIRIPVYGNSEAELKRNIASVRHELETGTYIKNKHMTLNEYASEWLKTYKEDDESVDIATYKKYKTTVTNYLAPISDMKLLDITKTDLQSVINLQNGHPDNQRMIRLTMNQILECAIDDGFIFKNVARSIKLKKSKASIDAKKASPIRPPFTDYEQNIIKKVKPTLSPMQRLYIDTLFVSGIRPGEALALSRNDVNNCTLTVSRAISWRGTKHIKSPKSQAGYREIDVPYWYQEEVDEYKKTCSSMYLFHNEDGSIIGSSPYKKMWNDIFSKLNYEMGGNENLTVCEISAYRFRHNYCTLLYYNGVDLKEAQRIMGHSDIRTTMNIYTHLDKKKSSTASKISNIAL